MLQSIWMVLCTVNLQIDLTLSCSKSIRGINSIRLSPTKPDLERWDMIGQICLIDILSHRLACMCLSQQYSVSHNLMCVCVCVDVVVGARTRVCMRVLHLKVEIAFAFV